MFAYVDPAIRQQLERDSRLVDLDRDGRQVDDGGEPYLTLLGPVPLPRTLAGRDVTFNWYAFVRRVELSRVLHEGARARQGDMEAFRSLLQSQMSVNSVLLAPGFFESALPLVRVHSSCLTGDVFGSLRCECGPQLDVALECVAQQGGAVVYMAGHEGRGIGLWAKAITYLLQDGGQDTYQANVSLGLPEDSRDFSDAGIVLRYLLAGRAMRLLSNNPLKRQQLQQVGVEVRELVPLLTGVSQHNRRYLISKREKGHKLPGEL